MQKTFEITENIKVTIINDRIIIKDSKNSKSYLFVIEDLINALVNIVEKNNEKTEE